MRFRPQFNAFCLVVLCCSFVVGCAPIDRADGPNKPKPPTPAESAITTAAKQAFSARDIDYATQLRALADEIDAGGLKYDAKLSQKIDQARQHAADASTSALAAVMSAEFGDNALQDPKRVARSLRDLAAALDK